ncbi:hypothetical protein PPERSA_08873 [Pseudocohnilembus persalinus]|uniref:EF-hand domain-containing protein n=1 Tax=Pseudocohnilembus persalinus TaxID=266149 RepID=A0A0V0R4K2_PSEPJ|nr:hypothetical protein PPERSA_08873 [Pseudocohnilembus persalinus]|eukprot:KRX09157.1 hypothetical protein PPERSA_08873 [Pseudocohnilembus persalinus]
MQTFQPNEIKLKQILSQRSSSNNIVYSPQKLISNQEGIYGNQDQYNQTNNKNNLNHHKPLIYKTPIRNKYQAAGGYSQKEFTLINLKKDAEDRAKAEKQVEKLDKNAISALKKAQQVAKLYQLDLGTIFKSIDEDKNGNLDCQEFTNFMKVISQDIKPEEAQHVFNVLDQDKKGYLSHHQFSEIFQEYDFISDNKKSKEEKQKNSKIVKNKHSNKNEFKLGSDGIYYPSELYEINQQRQKRMQDIFDSVEKQKDQEGQSLDDEFNQQVQDLENHEFYKNLVKMEKATKLRDFCSKRSTGYYDLANLTIKQKKKLLEEQKINKESRFYEELKKEVMLER